MLTEDAPKVIPWDEVETLVMAGLSVQVIVDRLGIPTEFERVKRRVSRKGWITRAHPLAKGCQSPQQTELDAATAILSQTKSQACPDVPSASQVLSQLGADSKIKLATAGNNAVTTLSQLSGDELIREKVALSAKSWAGTLSIAHGWGDAKAGDRGAQHVINIALMCHEPVQVEIQDGPVVEQDGL